MQNYQTFISKNVINVTFPDGTSKAVHATSPRYGIAIEALKRNADEAELRSILDGNLYVKHWAEGRFEITDNKVIWLSHPEFPIPQGLADRLLEYAANGYPAEAFVKFLDRLLENPSNRSVETFLSFVERHGLTITERGTFMAYKGCNSDLKDVHTGTFDNSPGTRHKMPRQLVSDDPAHACHVGFHCGSWEYANNFGVRMVLVEVDPKDLVCVPYDCDCQKIRCCEYLVVKEVTPEAKMRSFFSDEPEETDVEDEARFPNGRVECMECGTYCDAKDEFCRGCGSELPEPEEEEDEDEEDLTECPACGNEDILLDNNELATFCPKCGFRLTDD